MGRARPLRTSDAFGLGPDLVGVATCSFLIGLRNRFVQG